MPSPLAGEGMQSAGLVFCGVRGRPTLRPVVGHPSSALAPRGHLLPQGEKGTVPPMRTDLFDFDLPSERIALRPASPRDSARMLVVQPRAALKDRIVRDLREDNIVLQGAPPALPLPRIRFVQHLPIVHL